MIPLGGGGGGGESKLEVLEEEEVTEGLLWKVAPRAKFCRAAQKLEISFEY